MAIQVLKAYRKAIDENLGSNMDALRRKAELLEDDSFDILFVVVSAAQVGYLLTGWFWVWYISKGGCQNKSTLALTVIWGVLTQSVTIEKKSVREAFEFSCVDTRLLSCIWNGVFALMWTLAVLKSNMRKCKLRAMMETYLKISFSIGFFGTSVVFLVLDKFVTIKSPLFSKEILYTLSCKYELPDLWIPMLIEYGAFYIPAIVVIFVVYRHVKRNNGNINKTATLDKNNCKRLKMLHSCDNGSCNARSMIADSNCVCSTCAGMETTVSLFFVFFLAYVLLMRPAMMVYGIFNELLVKDDISPTVGVLGCLVIIYRISVNSFTVRKFKCHVSRKDAKFDKSNGRYGKQYQTYETWL